MLQAKIVRLRVYIIKDRPFWFNFIFYSSCLFYNIFMLIFIDESGDSGLKIDKGSSRYFTVSNVQIWPK